VTPPETEKGFGTGLRQSIERKQAAEAELHPAVAEVHPAVAQVSLVEPVEEPPLAAVAVLDEPEPAAPDPDLAAELDAARADVHSALERERVARDELEQSSRAVAEREQELKTWAHELDQREQSLRHRITELEREQSALVERHTEIVAEYAAPAVSFWTADDTVPVRDRAGLNLQRRRHRGFRQRILSGPQRRRREQPRRRLLRPDCHCPRRPGDTRDDPRPAPSAQRKSPSQRSWRLGHFHRRSSS